MSATRCVCGLPPTRVATCWRSNAVSTVIRRSRSMHYSPRISAPPATATAPRSFSIGAERSLLGAALVAVDERQRDAIGRASAGYVGDSDGWQDFARNGAMTWEYESAGPGNVALMAGLPRRSVLALGFGSSAEAAATLAISSLLQPFDNLLQQHITPWQAWQAERSERAAVPLDIPPALADEFLLSTVVLRSHIDKTYPGAMVASLSVPWGDTGN